MRGRRNRGGANPPADEVGVADGEAEWLSLLDAIPDAIVVTDSEGRIVAANARSLALFGYRGAELVGAPVELLVPDRLKSRHAAVRVEKATTHLTRPMDSGVELVGRRRDGTEFPADISLAPAETNGRRLMVAAVRDLTWRYRAAEARAAEELHTREAMLATAERIAHLGSWERDLVSGKGQWSDEVYRIFGYAPQAFAPTFEAFLAHVHPADRERVKDHVGAAIRERHAYSLEYRIVQPNGDERTIQAQGNPIHDGAGGPLRMVGTVQDVTDRRRGELQRRELEAQLHQSQKLESLGRLAGGVAHDFNNLLTVIVGYSQLVLDRAAEDPTVRRDVEQIHRASERGASLARQLLAFGRRQVLEPRVLDLNEVVRGVGAMTERLLNESVEVELRLAPEVGRVFADRGQLEQVLLNLSVNASDAMPDGGTLTFTTENVSLPATAGECRGGPEAGGFVRLSVSDTGTGVAPEARDHLFEPFFTTKEPGKGTGLGLSMVLGVVEQSGGTITCESELGVGTTFRIDLRCVLAELEPAAPDDDGGPRDPSGTETVLFAEDHDAVRELARRGLEQLGYTVLAARDGAEALELCASHDGPIHVLLTDVVMPHLGGRELGRRVSALRPGMPVIYMSGYTETAFGEDGTIPPGATFLRKPFTSSSLASKVREVLDRAPRESD